MIPFLIEVELALSNGLTVSQQGHLMVSGHRKRAITESKNETNLMELVAEVV